MSERITADARGYPGGVTRPWSRFQRALAWPLLYKVLFANSVVILLGATLGTYLATRLNAAEGIPILIAFILSGLLISVLINFALLKLALTPLTRLRETMTLAQAGDLTLKAPITGHDPDADRLAGAFNSMLQAIDDLSKSRARHILHAQEEERKRIARELHDETSQALTSLLISLALLEESVTDPTGRQRICDTRTLAHETLRAVRSMSLDLRPSALDDLGLLPALRWYVKEYQQKCGVEAELTVSGMKERLPPEVETALYRMIQESLTNTAKHAHARHVWVTLTEDSLQLRATIRDDGQGFDAASMLRKHWQDRGLGLAGMQERAALLDGAVEIESETGAGALITVTIPLRQAGRSRPSSNTHLARSQIEAPLMELDTTPELRLLNIAQVEPQVAPQSEMG
jgi:two-component system, NarL family, sensor histidine kinase UhpB